MSSRRIILTILLAALGLSAITGILAITVTSERRMFEVLWVAILTALASGLLLPLTLLTDRPRLRLTGFLAMAVVVHAWFCGVALVIIEGAGLYRWEEPLACSLLFTLFAGIPAVGISLLRPYPWARFAVPAFLGAAGGGWLLGQFAALSAILVNRFSIHGSAYRWEEQGVLSAIVVGGLGIAIAVLLLNFRCGDRRHFRFPAIALTLLDIALFLAALWLPFLTGNHDDAWPRAAFLFLIPAIVLAYINLLLMARLRASQQWLKYLTIGLTVLGGLIACPLPLLTPPFHPLFDILARLTMAFSLAVGSGGIALIVLSMLNRKPPALLAPGALTATDLTLFCPRCHTRQILPFGDAICKNCELLISIKVVEPRCPACGYLLYQLTSQKCPECGAQIRESSAPSPATLPAET